MRAHRRVLVQLPTGGGKTVIAATVAAGAHGKGRRVMFLVHRDELVRQTARTFADFGIPHGLIAAGHPTPDALVSVASVQTLARRLDRVPEPALLFVDEAHHAVAGTWGRILAAWPNAFVIGLSATPERLDGRGLGDVFQHMVTGPSTADLIASGYLSRYRAFAPSTVDLSGVRTAMGDFDQAGAAAAVDKPAIIGDIVDHYQRLAPGRRAIVFAASVAHSEHLAEAFRAAGIPAVHVDGATDRDTRRQAVEDFAAGRVAVLCNVELFGEGFDVPAVEAVILARPTQSLALHLQQVGRALRVAEGKAEALILDHVGNLARHGLPDDPREWSLNAVRRARKPADTGPAIRQCPDCYAVHRPAAACPECGHRYALMVRELEHRDGQLAEVVRGDWTGGIDIASARGREWFTLLDAAGDNIGRLRQIARARGFRRGWAMHRLRERQAQAEAAA
jgi:superfamily II DNA or RNA helicase